MRRKRAHIVWQPITRKKRKLRTYAQAASASTRLGEAQIQTEQPNLIQNPNHELTESSSTIQDTNTQKISYAETQTIPYDEFLLEKARTQWQFGDWESLANLNFETIQHHPDRAKLALLAAAGNLQTRDTHAAAQYIRLAQGWGCSKKLVSQILISGVHNSLGRAAAIVNQQHRALQHFENAITIGTLGNAAKLLTKARFSEQISQLGLNVPGGYPNLIMSAGEAAPVMLPRLSPHQPNASKSQFQMEYAFTIPIRIQDQEPLQLGFTGSTPEWITLNEQGLSIATAANKPLYLVSNETGEFQQPPARPQFPLLANALYKLSGEVDYQGDKRPILWVFQYAEGKKIDGKSFPIDSGQLDVTFRTLVEMSACAIGLRMLGQGNLQLQKTHFKLSKMTDEERTQQLEEQVANLHIEQQNQQKNHLQQMEAFMRLQHYLGQEIVLPEMHGWPISPDFGVALIKLIEQNNYNAVIEFGSGTSTLIIAKALQRLSQRNQTTPAPLLSFDHLQHYCDQTKSLLQAAKLTDNTRIVLAPLAPWADAEGQTYAYYSCQTALQTLKDQLENQTGGQPVQTKLLVVVDGPPATTGKQARYPALPEVIKVLGSANQYHFLMDDYLRIDEQQIVARWKNELEAKQIPTQLTEYKVLEKQACLLEVNPDHQINPQIN